MLLKAFQLFVAGAAVAAVQTFVFVDVGVFSVAAAGPFDMLLKAF